MRRVSMVCAAVAAVATTWAMSSAQAQQNRPAAAQAVVEKKAKPVSEVEQALTTQKLKLQFQDTPLKEALSFFGTTLNADIVLDRSVEDIGVSDDVPVTLQLEKREVTARTALELVLRRVSPELDFVVKENVILITGPTESFVTEVYPIAAIMPPAAKAANVAPMGGAPGGGEFSEGGSEFSAPPLTPEESLLQLITSTVQANSWNQTGGTGAANIFNGLLVVKNSPKAQREIRDLLALIAQAKRENKAPEAVKP